MKLQYIMFVYLNSSLFESLQLKSIFVAKTLNHDFIMLEKLPHLHSNSTI